MTSAIAAERPALHSLEDPYWLGKQDAINRVLFCGSRTWTNEHLIHQELLRLVHLKDIVIVGGAQGADQIAQRLAYQTGFWVEAYIIRQDLHAVKAIGAQKIRVVADWDKHHRAAGPIRNGVMLKEGKPTLVVAFQHGDSRGTQNMIDQATDAGVKVVVVHD